MSREKRENILLICIFLDVILLVAACLVLYPQAGITDPSSGNDSHKEMDLGVVKAIGSSAIGLTEDIHYITTNELAETALKEVGQKGGDKFWLWYGYDVHVDWCACFVSWCAHQNGLIENGKIPKFSYVPEGVNWYKARKRWGGAGKYEPKAGDLIFFQKKGGGVGVHVGIVVSVWDSTVYTVEGNKKDVCKKAHYPLNSWKILGYGKVAY